MKYFLSWQGKEIGYVEEKSFLARKMLFSKLLK